MTENLVTEYQGLVERKKNESDSISSYPERQRFRQLKSVIAV